LLRDRAGRLVPSTLEAPAMSAIRSVAVAATTAAALVLAGAGASAQQRLSAADLYTLPGIAPARSAPDRPFHPRAQRGAQGTPEERARAMFDHGVELADRLQWAEAAEAFERSYAILPRPGTLRNLGLAHRALGRYTAAIHEIEQFLREGQADPALRTEMLGLITEMRGQLATLAVNPSASGATVTLDEQRVPPGQSIEADPGNHVVSVTAAGYLRNAQTVTLGRAEHRALDVRLERAAGGGILAQWWFWTIVGVVVAGGVATAIVLGSHEADPDCGTLHLCVMPR
jgi:hypothetical protein